jgi:hypothetical protein
VRKPAPLCFYRVGCSPYRGGGIRTAEQESRAEMKQEVGQDRGVGLTASSLREMEGLARPPPALVCRLGAVWLAAKERGREWTCTEALRP